MKLHVLLIGLSFCWLGTNNEMYQLFKFRLYPNANQLRELETSLETHRRLYNSCLESKKFAYEQNKAQLSYNEQSRWFKITRETNPFFARINFSSAQQTLRRLDKAYKDFFRRIKKGQSGGKIRFKSKSRFNLIEFVYGDGCKIRDDKLYLQNIGTIRVKWHREIQGKIKRVAIKKDIDQWYAVFYTESSEATPKPGNKPVGIDMGIRNFLTTDGSHFVENPHFFENSMKELAEAQKSLCRKMIGGNNRKKQAIKVAKMHRKIRFSRRDFHHKVARSLVNEYDFIAVERLNIIEMFKNPRLSRKIGDAGWGQFISILTSKAESAGCLVVQVDPKSTSQNCSSCGKYVKKTHSTRIHECECGLVIDRDINAAKNILARALASKA